MKNAGGYEGYGALAYVYDKLNAQIEYTKWAAFCEACFFQFGNAKPELVLDLACGTGSMTLALAERGYDMIGIDGSADMLSVAMDRAYDAEKEILFLQQDMRTFELYGTVGAVTCCLDSVNYLLKPEDVRRTFRTVHNYLDPDGLFLFDVNTPYKFRHIYGDNDYILEEEDTQNGENPEKPRLIYCGWQNHFDEETHLCDFDLSLFLEEGDGRYTRQNEHQKERMYEREMLEKWLKDAGFALCGVFGDWNFSEPQADTERWYFVAKCIKE